MIQSTSEQQNLRVLITVKTYPIPSSKYDELVCTAGVTETGDFVRLYPINFRDLPYDKQFTKYQWIEVDSFKTYWTRQTEGKLSTGQQVNPYLWEPHKTKSW